MTRLAIIGAGGLGREIALTIQAQQQVNYSELGFVDDAIAEGTEINGVPVWGNFAWLLQQKEAMQVVLAIGNTAVRSQLIGQLRITAFQFPAIIHPGARLHDPRNIKVGKGCYVADGCILTTGISLGEFCLLNSACSIQHDVQLQDNVILMPGVRLTGAVPIPANTLVKANSVLP
jgi:sugar O-acyltransferase (sialic acid O-acetyltransferase NeuD family)